MIPGYERPEHILQQLQAFEREKRSAGNESHLEAINGQQAVFEAALAEFPASDVEKAKQDMAFAERVAMAPRARVMTTNVDHLM
jgi:hypothetical protein